MTIAKKTRLSRRSPLAGTGAVAAGLAFAPKTCRSADDNGPDLPLSGTADLTMAWNGDILDADAGSKNPAIFPSQAVLERRESGLYRGEGVLRLTGDAWTTVLAA